MTRSTYITTGVYLAALLVVWFFVWPFWQDIQTSRTTVEALEADVAHERQVVDRLTEIEETIAANPERIAQVERAIPASRDVASTIAIFEEASSNNGLSLADVNVTPPEETSTRQSKQRSVLKSVSTQLKMSGRYGAFTSFLQDIETSFPLFDISTISFSNPLRAGDEGAQQLQNPVLDFTVGLQMYYTEQ